MGEMAGEDGDLEGEEATGEEEAIKGCGGSRGSNHDVRQRLRWGGDGGVTENQQVVAPQHPPEKLANVTGWKAGEDAAQLTIFSHSY